MARTLNTIAIGMTFHGMGIAIGGDHSDRTVLGRKPILGIFKIEVATRADDKQALEAWNGLERKPK
jgi:hypothetical protein